MLFCSIPHVQNGSVAHYPHPTKVTWESHGACRLVREVPNKAVAGLLWSESGHSSLLIGLELEMDTWSGQEVDACQIRRGLI